MSPLEEAAKAGYERFQRGGEFRGEWERLDDAAQAYWLDLAWETVKAYKRAQHKETEAIVKARQHR